MTSIKVKFRPSAVEGSEGTIYYQIFRNRKMRQFSSEHHIRELEWDSGKSMIASDAGENAREIHKLIIKDLERLNRINRKLETECPDFTVDDIMEEYRSFMKNHSISNFMENLIERFIQNGQYRTSETYKSTLNSFMKFKKGKNLMLDRLDESIVAKYEKWLRQNGKSRNTSSFYIRILRAVYNRSLDHYLITDKRPFRHVFTGNEKTLKRALPLGTIKIIINLDLTGSPKLGFSRDMFLMSFYLRGMSLIDLAYLRKDNLKDGYIVYRRRKTGQLLTIKWTEEMQTLLDRYPNSESPYLMPILQVGVKDERNYYRNMCYKINRGLKEIGNMIGLKMTLTMYVARHSWASGARTLGIPISIISEGMGHDSEMTTQIYLSNLDLSRVDNANTKILDFLK